MSIVSSKRLFARWFVILPIALSVACGGQSCSSPSRTSAASAPTSEQHASALELREALTKAQQQLGAVMGSTPDLSHATAADVQKWLENSMAAVERTEREQSRETFDPAAIVGRVGRDRQALFTWIRDNTYLVPYRGVLRGSSGVLMDRMGNSLDRALLLAELVHSTGATVRLAHGQLSQEQASTLLGSVPRRPKRGSLMPTPESTAAVAEAVKTYATSNKLDPALLGQAVAQVTAAAQNLVQQFERRIGSQKAGITAALGTAAESSSSRTADVEALQDHWWVQSQQGNDWIDLDPTTPDAAPGRTLVGASEVFPVGNVPGDLYHRLTIRVIVESESHGHFQESTALEYGLRPLEAFGQHISLRHRPLNWQSGVSWQPREFRKNLDAALLAQKEWLPTLSIGGKTIAHGSFTESGAVNETPNMDSRPALQNPGAQVGGGLLGGLGGEETPAVAEGSLTAEWLEFEIFTPGRASEKIRRDVFDLVGPAARSRGVESHLADTLKIRRAMALMDETDLLPLTCQLSEEFVEHLSNTNLLRQRDALRALVRTGRDSEFKQLAESVAKIDRLPGGLYALAVAREVLSPVRDEVHLDRLNLFGTHRRIRPGNGEAFLRSNSIDIVSNPIATRSAANGFEVRLTQGLVDTAAENLFVTGCAKCTGTANVSELWATSKNQGIEWAAVRTPEELPKKTSALGADAQQRVERDLRDGYVVLVPSSPAPSSQTQGQGWWRIDPTSGNTLGIMESGEGQGLTEYKIVIVVVSIIAGLFTFVDCVSGDEYPTAKVVACAACGILTTGTLIAGFFAALALLSGAPAGTAALAFSQTARNAAATKALWVMTGTVAATISCAIAGLS